MVTGVWLRSEPWRATGQGVANRGKCIDAFMDWWVSDDPRSGRMIRAE
jgi:hypothetical protein